MFSCLSCFNKLHWIHESCELTLRKLLIFEKVRKQRKSSVQWKYFPASLSLFLYKRNESFIKYFLSLGLARILRVQETGEQTHPRIGSRNSLQAWNIFYSENTNTFGSLQENASVVRLQTYFKIYFAGKRHFSLNA